MTIKVYNARDVMEAQEIECILQENGIAAYHKDASGGVVGYTVSGFGLYGVDVFVDDADRERAIEIIGGIENAVYD